MVFFCLTRIYFYRDLQLDDFLPCIRPSRDRGIRIQAVSLSLVVIALIKLFKVPFSCALRSLLTIKHFQPTVFEPEIFTSNRKYIFTGRWTGIRSKTILNFEQHFLENFFDLDWHLRVALNTPSAAQRFYYHCLNYTH